MTVSECYRLWQGVPEWKKLASVSRDTAYRTLLKKHGCLEIDDLKRDTLTDLIHKSGRDARDMVQTESVIGHMLKWAQEQGYYHGDVTKTSQVIMIRPKIAVETPPGVKPAERQQRREQKQRQVRQGSRHAEEIRLPVGGGDPLQAPPLPSEVVFLQQGAQLAGRDGGKIYITIKGE